MPQSHFQWSSFLSTFFSALQIISCSALLHRCPNLGVHTLPEHWPASLRPADPEATLQTSSITPLLFNVCKVYKLFWIYINSLSEISGIAHPSILLYQLSPAKAFHSQGWHQTLLLLPSAHSLEVSVSGPQELLTVSIWCNHYCMTSYHGSTAKLTSPSKHLRFHCNLHFYNPNKDSITRIRCFL